MNSDLFQAVRILNEWIFNCVYMLKMFIVLKSLVHENGTAFYHLKVSFMPWMKRQKNLPVSLFQMQGGRLNLLLVSPGVGFNLWRKGGGGEKSTNREQDEW